MSKLRYMLPSTHSLFVFEAAARNLNFKLAAAELNVTQPSISHAIKAMERHCKIALFVRDNRGVQLTDAGRSLYESVRTSFVRIEQTLRSISSNDTRYITVAASTSVATHWLVPSLSHFQHRHPGIKIKIVTTDRDVEPDEEVDMTIWLRPRELQRTNSWYICDEIVFPVCSSAYLNRVATIGGPSDLLGLQLIHCFDSHRKRFGWNEWFSLLGMRSIDLVPNLVFNDYQLALQGAISGEGITLGWSFTCQRLLQNKLLIRPVEEEIRTDNAFFVIANERSSKLDELKPLVEWIVTEAQKP